MKKRLLSLLMALVLTMGLLPLSAQAAGSGTEYDESEIIYEIIPGFSEEDIILLTDLPTLSGLGNTSEYTGSFYDQLDEKSKALYDAIYESDLGKGPTTKTVTFDGVTYSNYNSDVYAAITALLFDHPELSWLYNSLRSGGFKVGRKNNELVSIELTEEGYKRVTTDPTGMVTEENHLYSYSGNIAEITKVINEIKSEIGDLSGKSDFDKVKALFDWICSNIRYPDAENSAEEKNKHENHWLGYQTAYGALVHRVSVCGGYAKAFKILCDAYDIPCAIVLGDVKEGYHAWDYVKVGDKWYAVDSTWGDAGTYINYNYFLKGSRNFTDHTEGGILYADMIFAYPKLSENDYLESDSAFSIEISCDPQEATGASSGVKYFMAPTIDELGKEKTKAITLSATVKDTNGQELTDKAVAWSLNSKIDGVTLTPNKDGTATLTISSSVLPDVNPESGTMTGKSIGVIAMCEGMAEKKLYIYVSHRRASFVQILKNGSAAATDSIDPGDTTKYTAKVYDQYGLEMSGEAVSWSISGGSGITVSNGSVTVPGSVKEGTTFKVAATSGEGSAQVAVTVGGAAATPSPPVTTDAPVVTPPVSTDPPVIEKTLTVTVAASIENDTAAFVISADKGDEIVNKAVVDGSTKIVIEANNSGSAAKAEVSIPAATLGDIGSKTGASLSVSTHFANMTFPNDSLGALSGEGNTITFSTGYTENGVDLLVTADGKTVDKIPGGFTVFVGVSSTTPGTVAKLVNNDGTRKVVRKSVAGDTGVTIPLDGSARVKFVYNNKKFNDVPSDSWMADAVDFVSARELFNGTAEGQFSPGVQMSRAMLAVVLHNLEDNPAQTQTVMFSDVSSGSWYINGLAWAVSEGIVSGYGNGKFGPNDSITREQLAVILWRYSGKPASGGNGMNFTDLGEVSDYAMDALRWAVGEGIISGKGGGVLDPRGKATRAEVATMLMRYVQNAA